MTKHASLGRRTLAGNRGFADSGSRGFASQPWRLRPFHLAHGRLPSWGEPRRRNAPLTRHADRNHRRRAGYRDHERKLRGSRCGRPAGRLCPETPPLVRLSSRVGSRVCRSAATGPRRQADRCCASDYPSAGSVCSAGAATAATGATTRHDGRQARAGSGLDQGIPRLHGRWTLRLGTRALGSSTWRRANVSPARLAATGKRIRIYSRRLAVTFSPRICPRRRPVPGDSAASDCK